MSEGYPDVPGFDERGVPEGKPLLAEEIGPREAAEGMRRGEMLVVDVRENEELRSAAVEGALHVRLGELPGRLGEIERAAEGRRVAFLCHGGVRSLRAARLAREHGMKDAMSVAGGIDLWSVTVDRGVPRY